MSDGFTIGAAMQTPTIFQCLGCNETIDSSAATCRFCGAAVDHEQAIKAAQIMAKVNQACSDASYLRSTALAYPGFFVVRLVPFVSMLGTVGFYGLSFAIPIWALRWWLKFAKLESADQEFRKARNTVKTVGILVSLSLLVFVFLPIVRAILIVMRN
jgi:hypothetical protein